MDRAGRLQVGRGLSRRTGLVLVLAAASCVAWPGPSGAAAAEPSPYEDPTPYAGTGAWIDIHDAGALSVPLVAVARMSTAGVRTLYVETANSWSRTDVVRPRAIAALVEAAHDAGIQVVAWYLPSFRNLAKDWRRVRAALKFRTGHGERFDSFALDIEANSVNPISRRNQRLRQLTRRIRKAVGKEFVLGAIIPDRLSTTSSRGLWPHLPFKWLNEAYEVFLPMAYSSTRGEGASFVSRYTKANIAHIREQAGDPSAPVHMIGGIANRLDAGEARAVVRAARSAGATGVSFYDLATSGREDWAALPSFSAP